MRDRRCVEDLTVKELEEVLLTRRREERLARMRRMRSTGRLGSAVQVQDIEEPDPVPAHGPISSGGAWSPALASEPGMVQGHAQSGSGSGVWRMP